METGDSTRLPEQTFINLKFAEVHTPIFFAGKNHGVKLDPSKLPGLKLTYDRVQKELLIGWGDNRGYHECIVPISNVASMTPGETKERVITPVKTSNPIVPAKVSAQVETPQSHVFGGPGQGRTR